MGRPTKLTPERMKRIVDAIRAGNYLDTAAEYGGISHQTFYNWMDRGRTEKERVEGDGRTKVREDEAIFVEFFESVTRARAEAETRNVALIQQASREDWRAAAWFLERSFQERWGKKQQLVGDGGGPVLAEIAVTRRIVTADDDS